VQLTVVILRHDQNDGGHYDLMIEDPAADAPDRPLLTWRCDLHPRDWSAAPFDLAALGPHRRAYIDYEGPLTGDRGSVRRVDRGPAMVLDATPDGLRLDLHLAHAVGTLELTRAGGDRWTARLI